MRLFSQTPASLSYHCTFWKNIRAWYYVEVYCHFPNGYLYERKDSYERTEHFYQYKLIPGIREKSVGTTELHYCTKKRYHVLTILKSLFSSDEDKMTLKSLFSSVL